MLRDRKVKDMENAEKIIDDKLLSRIAPDIVREVIIPQIGYNPTNRSLSVPELSIPPFKPSTYNAFNDDLEYIDEIDSGSNRFLVRDLGLSKFHDDMGREIDLFDPMYY